jgi:hypothetical protein
MGGSGTNNGLDRMWKEIVMPLFWLHTLSWHSAWRERRSPGGDLNRASPEYAAGALHLERVYCTPSFLTKRMQPNVRCS